MGEREKHAPNKRKRIEREVAMTHQQQFHIDVKLPYGHLNGATFSFSVTFFKTYAQSLNGA